MDDTEREHLELTYEALLNAYIAFGGEPRHADAAERAACTKAQAVRMWSKGAPALGAVFMPISAYFEDPSVAIAEAQTLTPIERRARIVNAVRAYQTGVAATEIVLTRTATRLAASSLLSMSGLQEQADRLAGVLAEKIEEMIAKAHRKEDGAPSLVEAVALLERIQRLAKGALDLAAAAMAMETLRASRPDTPLDASAVRSRPEAEATIEHSVRVLNDARKAASITTDELARFGTLPKEGPGA